MSNKIFPEFNQNHVIKDNAIIMLGEDDFITGQQLKRLKKELEEAKESRIEDMRRAFDAGLNRGWNWANEDSGKAPNDELQYPTFEAYLKEKEVK